MVGAAAEGVKPRPPRPSGARHGRLSSRRCACLSSLTDTLASIDVRDSSVIGMCLPANAADPSVFPADTPVAISTDDATLATKMGPGTAYDAIRQIASEGIVAKVIFTRCGAIQAQAYTATEAAALVAGDPVAKTGVHALLNAKALTGYEPGIVIAPGLTAQTVGAAIDAVVTRIGDAVGVIDAPSTTAAAAIAHAALFATSTNIIDCSVGAKVSLDGSVVTRALSPHVAAMIVKRDQEAGSPFKASWNRGFKGVLGPSRPIEFRLSDPACEANTLVQAGLVTVIEGKVFWGPYTTATDPTVRAWRSIKRIRTRRAIERALQTPLRLYLAEDVTPHAVTLLYDSIDNFMDGLRGQSAIIDHEIVWDRTLNPNTLLRDGGLRVVTRWRRPPISRTSASTPSLSGGLRHPRLGDRRGAGQHRRQQHPRRRLILLRRAAGGPLHPSHSGPDPWTASSGRERLRGRTQSAPAPRQREAPDPQAGDDRPLPGRRLLQGVARRGDLSAGGRDHDRRRAGRPAEPVRSRSRDWTTFTVYQSLLDATGGDSKAVRFGRIVILKGLVFRDRGAGRQRMKAKDKTKIKLGSIVKYQDILAGRTIHKMDVVTNALVINAVNYSAEHNRLIAA